MKKLLLIIMSTLLLVSCSSLRTLDDYDPRVMAAKSYSKPPVGKTGVYIYRPVQFVGYGYREEVRFNGKSLGKLAPGTFFYFLVDSDKNYFVETTYKDGLIATVRFKAVSGKNVFIEKYVELGVGMQLRQTSVTAAYGDIGPADMAIPNQ